MPKRSDARTLKNLIDKAYLIDSSDPVPKGGMESLRENLDAARALVRVLLLRPDAETIAADAASAAVRKRQSAALSITQKSRDFAKREQAVGQRSTKTF